MVDFENDTRAERLAKALLADNAVRAAREVRHNIVACFSCGHTFVYRGRQGAASTWIGSDEDGHPSPDTSLSGRFCSMRCQDWFDDGNPSYEEQCEHERDLIKAPLDTLIVVAGPPGLEPGTKAYNLPKMPRRRDPQHEADYAALKKFMVAADIPFTCEMDYLAKGWKSPLRRPAVTPSADPPSSSDWRISGKWGSVFNAGRGSYLLTVETKDESAGSFMHHAPAWDEVLTRLDFCHVEAEGYLRLKGLPKPRQAVAICSVLGIPRNRESKGTETTETAEARS